MKTIKLLLIVLVSMAVSGCGLFWDLSENSDDPLPSTNNNTAQKLTVGTTMTNFTPITATGGTGPYFYSKTGTLPAGLDYSPPSLGAAPVVSGTPTAPYATADVVFSVHDSTDPSVRTASCTVSFTVVAAGSIIATADTTAQNLIVGTAMTSFTPLAASLGTPPYTYSHTNALPAGLSFSAGTGAVSGTPTAAYAPANLVFSVQDANGNISSTTSTVSFNVSDGSAGAGTWTTTGNLITKRSEHSATKLLNGKVLVTGGFGSGGIFVALASTELYDPATGSWTATGSLNTACRYPVATLLKNGKVLVMGQTLVSAELYDPATGIWTATGSLATARSGFTATLLTNGKVLVTGGSAIASAELYDPATGSWTATGSPVASRYGHTATLLGNGQVLVTGGSGPVALVSAELYDPLTGNWTTTGSLVITARMNHSAILLDNGKVLVMGGQSISQYLASAELYDPATGTWTATGSLASARNLHTTTLLGNGKVLVTGGVLDGVTRLASAELYDPGTEIWTATSSFTKEHYSHSATLLGDGKVLVTGGTETAGLLVNSELYW